MLMFTHRRGYDGHQYAQQSYLALLVRGCYRHDIIHQKTQGIYVWHDYIDAMISVPYLDLFAVGYVFNVVLKCKPDTGLLIRNLNNTLLPYSEIYS